MAALADLQPDRRAVLKLLIGRGRGYDQIAELLQLPELVVRRRAHDAITELAGGKGDIDDAQRALLCDYLVGELPASRRAEARKLLADDAGARRFARSAAARLSGIEGAQLPELPAEDEEVAEALDALDARRERQAELQTSSKRGAWFLIGGLAVAVIAVVVVLSFVGGGGDNATDSSASETPAATQTASSSTSTSPAGAAGTLVAELKPPSGTGAAKGQAALKPNTSGAVILALHATGVSGTLTSLAFWLEGPSAKPLLLGFYTPIQDGTTPPTPGSVDLGVTLDGAAGSPLSAKDLDKYSTLLITREVVTSTKFRPTKPGKTVLIGTLANVG